MARMNRGRVVGLGISAVLAAGIAAGTTGVALAATSGHQNTAARTTSSTTSGRTASSAAPPSASPTAASPPASPSPGHGAPGGHKCTHMGRS